MDLNALRVLPQWPRFLGPPAARGELRSCLEDFRVDELPQVSPSGAGAHLWVQLTKRGANTDWIAGQLALAAGCAARDVGYAGMKDRHAVTTQWFSLPMAVEKEAPWREWQIPDATIIQAARHQKKLKRGVLTGNRFRIVVRNIQGDKDELLLRLEQVRLRGLPNYFGPQRFGHAGDNVWKAAQPGWRKGDEYPAQSKVFTCQQCVASCSTRSWRNGFGRATGTNCWKVTW